MISDYQSWHSQIKLTSYELSSINKSKNLLKKGRNNSIN